MLVALVTHAKKAGVIWRKSARVNGYLAQAPKRTLSTAVSWRDEDTSRVDRAIVRVLCDKKHFVLTIISGDM